MAQTDRTGIGGGGALYDPQIAWWNPDLWFVACDMTGLYRSIDGGRHWTMLDTRQVHGSNRFSVAIHPLEERILGYHPFQGFKEGLDGGLRWQPIAPGLNNSQSYPTGTPIAASPVQPAAAPQINNARSLVVTAMSWCPDNPRRILAGTECGIMLFDAQATPAWRWVYPLVNGAAARYDTFDIGNQVGNAAEVLSFTALPDPSSGTGKWIYFCATSNAVLRSDDGGSTWADITGGLPSRPLGTYYPGSPFGDTIASPQSVDPAYQPSRIRALSGGIGSALGGGSHVVLYTAVATTLSTGTPPGVDGGVYAYDTLDQPPSWQRVMQTGINIAVTPTVKTPSDSQYPDDRNGVLIPRYLRVATSRTDPHTVYVNVLNTYYHFPSIYRGSYSRTGGQSSVSWSGVYNGFQKNRQAPPQSVHPGAVDTNLDGAWIETDFGWGFGNAGNGLTVDPNNVARVAMANTAAVHVSENATDPTPKWSTRYSDEVPDPVAPWWRTTGLDVTTTWQYARSPGRPERHFIANTDIGLSRSVNASATWRSLVPGCDTDQRPFPAACQRDWRNIYQLAFEGADNIWAAASAQQDLPYRDQSKVGAILHSADAGDTWTELTTTGLPQATATRTVNPVTSVIRGAARTYAALWRDGVYQLLDGGTQWTEVAVPNATMPNLASLQGQRAYRLHMIGSTVYCVVSDDSPRSGLWAFDTTAATGWAPVGAAGKFRVIDLAVDPNTNDLYLCTGNRAGQQGGIHKWVAGDWHDVGAPFATRPDLWNTIVAAGLSFVGDMAYATSITQGTWCARQIDLAGFTPTGQITWVHYTALPFSRSQRVTEHGDPQQGRSTLMLTSYGGGVGRVNRTLQFIVDRGTFSQGEVNHVAGTAPNAPFTRALYVVADGFLPLELNATTVPALSAKLTVSPGTGDVTLTRDPNEPVLLEQPSLPPDRFQRIAFPLTVTIARNATFPQQVAVAADLGRYHCNATLNLVTSPLPFMADGPTPWLSTDVAAFQVLEGQSVAGVKLDPNTSGSDFIQKVLDQVQVNPSSFETEFESLRDGPGNILQLSEKVSGTRVLNFALARVHNGDPLQRVTDFGVFFRLFTTAWTGLEYDTGQTFRTATTGSRPIPVLGVKTGAGQGGALVSAPCFAGKRNGPSALLSQQTDPYNYAGARATNDIAAGGIQFYGCFLDINQPSVKQYPAFPGLNDGPFSPTATAPLLSIQELIRGRHQCLMVEIYRGLNLIPEGATTGSSDRLSQRNLVIVGCDNPGPSAAHLVQHTFELKAPLRVSETVGNDEPRRGFADGDALIVINDNLPGKTFAHIRVAGLAPEQLLQAQEARPGGNTLHRIDDATVGFTPGPLTTVILPEGIAVNLPALLSVQLPEGVKAGQEFRCRLQQWSQGYVIGQVEVRIPVQKPSTLLPEEQDTLSVFTNVLESLDHTDPWHTILTRYVAHTADRVRALTEEPRQRRRWATRLIFAGAGGLLAGVVTSLVRRRARRHR